MIQNTYPPLPLEKRNETLARWVKCGNQGHSASCSVGRQSTIRSTVLNLGCSYCELNYSAQQLLDYRVSNTDNLHRALRSGLDAGSRHCGRTPCASNRMPPLNADYLLVHEGSIGHSTTSCMSTVSCAESSWSAGKTLNSKKKNFCCVRRAGYYCPLRTQYTFRGCYNLYCDT